MRDLTPDEIETLRRAGIAWPEDAEDQREVARRLQERVAEVAEAITRAAEVFVDALAAAFGSTVELYEELKDLGVDLPEREPEQHDGAITQAAIEVLLPLILRELYGQGVDYGGLAHPVGDADPRHRRWPTEGRNGKQQERRTTDGNFHEYRPGDHRRGAAAGRDRRAGQGEAAQCHLLLPGGHGYDRRGEHHHVRDCTMKQYRGYKLVEVDDLDAATAWAKGIVAEDPEKQDEIALLRDVLVTGLTYARVVAANMGGLPCFAEGQTEKERQAAIAAAAKMARRPDGRGKGKKGGKK